MLESSAHRHRPPYSQIPCRTRIDAASCAHANRTRVATRGETPPYLTESPSSGPGPILRNCLFIERNKNTQTTASAATIRKQSTPVWTAALLLVAAVARALIAPPSPGCPRTRHLLAARC